ncbi:MULTISPECIES: mercury(II) reductase [Cellulomonas]|uniref:Mercuric reductase n=1 Tax=Cellulomonas uda TaxID=1714 RepID=A0A4Y3K5E8_CELUD|nr:mercury(II) reductase [Cellulomonas sp. PSBB021]NCT90429.1 mercury(II) reductase [Cellulomonas sp. APG4]GEA79719.1 mercuric reductase MerA [Cellulomonas uda]
MGMEETWDLVVIGSGGAAMAAGIEARSRGKSVLLVEHGVLGGTCLNVGCIPSKNLLAAAGRRHRALVNPFPGLPTGAGGVDLAALMAQKQELIDRLRQAKYTDVAEAHGFPVMYGHARFVDEQTLEVDGERVAGAAYIVATGSAAHIPALPGMDTIDPLTSTTAMELQDIPSSMVVLGGGYVGLEQAQLWSQLGVAVTLVGRLAPHAEPEVADVLRTVFADDGITVVEERAVALERTADGAVLVRTERGAQLTGQRLLVATGRHANTDDLGLDDAGVHTDDRRFITVDAHQRTSNPRIFAAGDVSGAPQYVYVAAQTGHAAAAGALGRPTTVDYRGLPSVTFTTPQLASAGLTEQQALAAGHECDSRVLDAQDIPRSLANRDTRGTLKVVVDAHTRKILGVHAALDGAGDVMLAATYAIKFGLTVDDLADTWAPYLTMSEALRICAGLFRSDMPTSCCA